MERTQTSSRASSKYPVESCLLATGSGYLRLIFSLAWLSFVLALRFWLSIWWKFDIIKWGKVNNFRQRNYNWFLLELSEEVTLSLFSFSLSGSMSVTQFLTLKSFFSLESTRAVKSLWEFDVRDDGINLIFFKILPCDWRIPYNDIQIRQEVRI